SSSDHPSPIRGHARAPPAPRARGGAQIRRARVPGAGGRHAAHAGGHGGAGGGQGAHGLRRLWAARRRFPRSRRLQRGEPGHPRSARPPAHARAPVPAAPRRPGHPPGHGRARRSRGRDRRARPRRRRLRHAPAHPAVRRTVPAAVRRGGGRGRNDGKGLTGGPGREMLTQSDRIGSDRIHLTRPGCEEKQVPRALLLTGDAAEELDTMYPYYRVQEGGWDVDVSSRTMRDVQLVIHEFDPDSDAYVEKNGRKLPVDVPWAEVDVERYDAL